MTHIAEGLTEPECKDKDHGFNMENIGKDEFDKAEKWKNDSMERGVMVEKLYANQKSKESYIFSLNTTSQFPNTVESLMY